MAIEQSTAAALLQEGRQALGKAGFESSGLDAEILLRTALSLSREQLFMRLPDPVPAEQAELYWSLIEQRLDAVPIAYITGIREFYGREFIVSPHVLVPRPETEYLVEWSVDWLKRNGHARRRVVDAGTGSGAIAVSIADETANAHEVIGSDISIEALHIARRNRDRHACSVHFVAGSVLDWLNGTVHLIAANLPYLREDQAHDGIRHEPSIALFAEDEGFALNRALLRRASTVLGTPGAVIMEIDPEQHELAWAEATRSFAEETVTIESDLAGLDRYLVIERN